MIIINISIIYRFFISLFSLPVILLAKICAGLDRKKHGPASGRCDGQPWETRCCEQMAWIPKASSEGFPEPGHDLVMIWWWICYKNSIAPMTSVSNRWILLLQFEWRFWKRKWWYLDLHLIWFWVLRADSAGDARRRWGDPAEHRGCEDAGVTDVCENRRLAWTELEQNLDRTWSDSWNQIRWGQMFRDRNQLSLRIGTSCHLGAEALWMLTSLEQEFVVFWEDHEETVWTTTRNLQL